MTPRASQTDQVQPDRAETNVVLLVDDDPFVREAMNGLLLSADSGCMTRYRTRLPRPASIRRALPAMA